MEQRPIPEVKDCIEVCQKCHNICVITAMNHCLEAGGKCMEAAHFRLVADCASLCQTTADFMLRNSDFHDQLCLDCAMLCDYCATSCEQLGGMNDCVEACRNCAESCHQMAVAMY